MKLTRIMRAFVFAALLGPILLMISSCSSDDESSKIGYGTITGIVTDDDGAPLSGVTVTVTDTEGSATTGTDGKYTFQNVSMETHAVIFTKLGYQKLSATVVAGKFNNRVATIDVTMPFASAIINGTITDAKNKNAPLAGVKVTLGSLSTESGDDGKYKFEYLSIEDYEISFSKTNYPTITRTIKKEDFINGEVELNMIMGSAEILRGLSAVDLALADKWYYNEYRGGGNGDALPHWDWACDYMCALSFMGDWEEQWEGTTLRIRNGSNDQSNPADLEMFDSYTYGSKLITEDNKILSLRVRTHEGPAIFGVQVVDLSADNPVAVKIGENKQYDSGNYEDFDFDLSDYIGKEIVIAIGTYRAQTGDYWRQLVLRAIRFANTKVSGFSWLPGTEVISGWKLTHDMVRSTMPHTKKTFTGITSREAKRELKPTDPNPYPLAYREWRETSHVGYEWALMPVNKDPEVTPSEGYLIKTRGNMAPNTNVPEAYFYAKFAIESGNNQLTFRTRNFGSNYTFFKVTAIDEEGNVVHLQPKSNTANEASAADNGCWKLKHDNGAPNNPASYAAFEYDLSPYNGKNLVIAIGVYKGEVNDEENKLVFRSIELN